MAHSLRPLHRYYILFPVGTSVEIYMTRWLLIISRAIAYLVRPYLFWKEGRNLTTSDAEDGNKALPAFEDENQIAHARLSHFADQIGRWHISSATKKQVGEENNVTESSPHRNYRLIQNFRL